MNPASWSLQECSTILVPDHWVHVAEITVFSVAVDNDVIGKRFIQVKDDSSLCNFA